LEEHAILDLGALISSPTLGVELLKNKNLKKKKQTYSITGLFKVKLVFQIFIKT